MSSKTNKLNIKSDDIIESSDNTSVDGIIESIDEDVNENTINELIDNNVIDNSIVEFEYSEKFKTSIFKAKLKILQLKPKSNICVFTDANDVDGIFGALIDYIVLTKLGHHVRIYGSFDRTTNIGTKHVDLIITNDVGVNINFNFNNVIITDHHVPLTDITDTNEVIYVINQQICGACISYLLMKELTNDYEVIEEYAALATIADVVPHNEFNRTLINKLYAKIINRQIKSKHLDFIFEMKNIYDNIDSMSLSFFVIPMFNAPMKMYNVVKDKNGKIVTGEKYIKRIITENEIRTILSNDESLNEIYINWKLLIDFMLSEDFDMKLWYTLLETINTKRKNLVNNFVNEIVEIIDKHIVNTNYEIRMNNSIIEVKTNLIENHITGLIASKINRMYNKTVIVIGKMFSSIRGNGAMKILDSNKKRLVNYGGHECAAGFKLKPNEHLNIDFDIPQTQNAIIDINQFDMAAVKEYICENHLLTENILFNKVVHVKGIKNATQRYTEFVSKDDMIFKYFGKIDSVYNSYKSSLYLVTREGSMEYVHLNSDPDKELDEPENIALNIVFRIGTRYNVIERVIEEIV